MKKLKSLILYKTSTIFYLLSLLLIMILASCGMSTLQTPLTTPKGHLLYHSSAVFAGEVMDPAWNIPMWTSSGLRYGIIDKLDTGISFFGDAAIADVKYGIIENRENGLCVALRGAGGYGPYSQSYTAFEPIGGWNYQNIALPYLSLKSMSFWNHQIYTFSPALGVSILPNENISFIMETRFYVDLPSSNRWSDVDLPSQFGFNEEETIEINENTHLRNKSFSFHIGVSVDFDPYFFY